MATFRIVSCTEALPTLPQAKEWIESQEGEIQERILPTAFR